MGSDLTNLPGPCGPERVHISPKKCQAFNSNSSKSAQKARQRVRLWVLREHARGEQSHSEAQSLDSQRLRTCLRLVSEGRVSSSGTEVWSATPGSNIGNGTTIASAQLCSFSTASRLTTQLRDFSWAKLKRYARQTRAKACPSPACSLLHMWGLVSMWATIFNSVAVLTARVARNSIDPAAAAPTGVPWALKDTEKRLSGW